MQAGATRPVGPNRPPQYTQSQLDQFFDAHDRFIRRQSNGRHATMRFIQAQGMDLTRRMLMEADFTGGSFEDARMRQANFERASLFCADLTRVDARQANFRRSDMRGACLNESILEGADMEEADLREAVLAVADSQPGLRFIGHTPKYDAHGALVFAVDFTNCQMRKVKLASAKLKGANFQGAMLEGADLTGANLAGANFHGAILTGAKLERAKLDPGALEGSVLDPTNIVVARAAELLERLRNAETWLKSNGREGAVANLDGEDLRPLGEAFKGRRLPALSAKIACAVGVSFASASLQAARFDGADLRNADFSNADLRGASFHGANLWHARFDQADLRALPLGEGRAAPTDLSEAEHGDSVFDRAVR